MGKLSVVIWGCLALYVLWKYGKIWQKLKQRNSDVEVYLCLQITVILLASLSAVLILERFKAKIG